MKKLFILLSLFLSLYCRETLAQAVVIDAAEDSSRSVNVIQKVQNTYNKTMEKISNSKMGKAIGDGTKQAKKGVSYAKGLYNKAMYYYRLGLEVIEEAKNSPEYRAAKISKNIASEKKRIDALEKEKSGLEEVLQQKISLAQKKAEADIRNLQQNNQNARVMAAGDSSMQGVIDDNNAQIQQIRTDLQTTIAGYNRENQQRLSEIEASIQERNSNLQKLAQDLLEVANVKIEDPREALKKSKENFTLKDDENPTIKTRQRINEQRYKERRQAVYDVYTASAAVKYNRKSLTDEAESVNELIPLMGGESDGSGIHTQILLKEADMLRRYIDYVLADLQMEAAVEMANLDVSKVGDLEELNLCSYYDPKSKTSATRDKAGGLKGLVSNVKSTVEKGKNTLNNVKNKVEEAKDIVNEGRELINNAGDVAGDVVDNVKNQVQDEALNTKGMF